MFNEETEKKLQLNLHMTRAFTLGFYAHIQHCRTCFGKLGVLALKGF